MALRSTFSKMKVGKRIKIYVLLIKFKWKMSIIKFWLRFIIPSSHSNWTWRSRGGLRGGSRGGGVGWEPGFEG